MQNDEFKEHMADVEDRIRYDIHEIANQLKDIHSEVNTLKQQVTNLEGIIRMVEQNNAAVFSGIQLDIVLIKDALGK